MADEMSKRCRVLDQTIAEIRLTFADVPAEELQAIIQEAVTWARAEQAAESGTVHGAW